MPGARRTPHLTFAEHDSYFRGGHPRAETGHAELKTQPTAIPGDGDDGKDDHYASEHAACQTLILATSPAPNSKLNASLASIEGLEAPTHEVF
ncbi:MULTISPECIES: hypothetical protein [unclassified Streptomyces]|uniref:Uncharacterized protein n=1 Tax=Streptomyces sp. NBC_00060 TaxID=2975636 RepID=A0AAU2H967_9ACTN